MTRQRKIICQHPSTAFADVMASYECSWCKKQLKSPQNGYQSQKRSLVEDAKFETRVHNESKKSWLQAVRQQSEGGSLLTDILVGYWV